MLLRYLGRRRLAHTALLALVVVVHSPHFVHSSAGSLGFLIVNADARQIKGFRKRLGVGWAGLGGFSPNENIFTPSPWGVSFFSY